MRPHARTTPRPRPKFKAETARTNLMHEARIRQHIERVEADEVRLRAEAERRGLRADQWHQLVERPLHGADDD